MYQAFPLFHPTIFLKIMLLEVCTNSLISSIHAQEGGAHRIELCQALSEGGVTPSVGMLRLTRKRLHIPIYVLIRPRGGNFCYNSLEIQEIKEDIHICKEEGADGVVIGCLLPNGEVDVTNMQLLIDAAGKTPVTFHRAFDVAIHPFQALSTIIELGCARVLTSGQKNTAYEGRTLIRQLIEKAANKIIIMPGSGITESNIAAIVQDTRAKEVHCTGKKWIPTAMTYTNSELSYAIGGTSDKDYVQTDRQLIKNMTTILRNF